MNEILKVGKNIMLQIIFRDILTKDLIPSTKNMGIMLIIICIKRQRAYAALSIYITCINQNNKILNNDEIIYKYYFSYNSRTLTFLSSCKDIVKASAVAIESFAAVPFSKGKNSSSTSLPCKILWKYLISFNIIECNHIGGR